MSILIFALVVLLVAVLLIAAFRYIPGVPAPLNWLVPALILLIAAVVIANGAGMV